MKKFLLFGVLTSALSAVASSIAPADVNFPVKPIHLVVPFAPGGGADYNARRIAQALSSTLKQPIVIENVAGAGGSIGANKVAKALPDGYTLLYTTPGQQMTAPYLINNLPYDAFKDLRPVSQISAGTNVLVVNKNFPARTIRELIDYAKKNPGKVSFASSGLGSTSHLAGELFKSMAGIDIVHVPYKGSMIAANDLVGGHIEMSIDTLSIYLPHIQSNAVRVLGVSTLTPNPLLTEIPPIGDTLAGFEASPVNYISAPGKTPEPIIQKINIAIQKVASDQNLRKIFATGGSDLKASSPEEIDALVRSEQIRWKKVIDSAGISIKTPNK